MDTTLKKDKYGLVQTGAGTSVNPQFATPQAMQQARTYAGVIDPTISATEIGSVKPYVLPESKAETKVDGLGGLIEGYVEGGKTKALQDELATEATAAEGEKVSALSEFKNKVLEKIGIQQSKSKVQGEFKIPELTQKYDEITNEIESKDRAMLNELRALETSGKSPEALQAAARDIKQRYNFEKADLAVLQLAAGRRVDSARSLADEKIQAQLEPIDTYLGMLKDFIDVNKADWSAAKARKYDLKFSEVEAERGFQEQQHKMLSDTKIDLTSAAAQQGAPADVLRAITLAKTPEEAIAAAGEWGGDKLERQYKIAQLNKLNADVAKVNAEARALELPPINPKVVAANPEQSSGYTAALEIILGSGKFTKDQKADVIRAVNNGQDPFATIKNQAKNIMGQTLATQLDKYETAKSQMESIDDMLQQYYALGGKTNIFSGNFEKVTNKLGEVKDPKLVEIATNISSALQIYRNAVSGTAYSVQEGKDISSIFPGINKSQGLNEAILTGRMKAFDNTIDSSYRNTLGSAYDQLKGGTAAAKTGGTVITAPDGTQIEIID